MMSHPRCYLTLASGRSVDLVRPTISDYADFDAIAEGLAKENRYNGATPGAIYSVAQHQALGALAAFEATGDRALAAYFSVHDNPEALLKDDTTPKKNALAEIADASFGQLAQAVRAAFEDLNDRHESVAHAAAGLAWPVPSALAKQVKYFDRVMLITEWRDLMAGAELPGGEAWRGLQPLTMTIKPLDDWRTAKAMLLEVWREFLPALGGRAS